MSDVEPSPPRRPRLFVVALSHLDTQWRWTVRETAAEFLPRTVRENEDRFRAFPGYCLSFEGAKRYRLLADCHPGLLEIVRARVAEGRWFPAGAAWEAFDANLPSPESIVRQILLGRRELDRAVGRSSDDLFLPDCFGFPASLPTVAAHCGIFGFSTQKLRRGAEMRAARGIPFPFGRWRGADGAELLAVLDPGEYGAQARGDLAADPEWVARFETLAGAGRPALLQTYQGLGDKGGAIARETASWLETATRSDGPIEVAVAPSERIYRETSSADRERLPAHEGELLLRLHATGCYTSRSQLKRWHRGAEDLGAASERAAALASPYVAPRDARAVRDSLRRSWELVLSHQMHDDLTGTSIPAAYRHGAADLAAALGGFADELDSAAAAIAGRLDTDTEGEPILIFNPVAEAREELVEIEWPAATGDAPPRAFDPDGNEAPSQWTRLDSRWRGVVLARLPGLSFALFELRPGAAANRSRAPDPAGSDALENELFALRIGPAGDLVSWLDRTTGEELLSAPVAVELLANRSERFPSWEIHHEDLTAPPLSTVGGTAELTVVESGPLRRRIRVRQAWAGSHWVRDYLLAAGGRGGAGEIAEIRTAVEWRTDGVLAKASFPFAWPFAEALYDLGVGVAARPVSTPELYEVPAQGWAAAPRAAGGGALVLSDVKQGWDHPEANRLRLSLLHTPRIGRRFRYQRRQDFGAHRFRIGLATWSAADGLDRLARLGERFRQPLRAFRVPRGRGGDSRRYAPLDLGEPAIALMALKPAEAGEGLVLRLRNTVREPRSPRVLVAPPFRAGRTLDGAERALPSRAGDADAPIPPFGLRALEITLVGPKAEAAPSDPPPEAASELALELPRSIFAVRSLGERAYGAALDRRGRALPRHLVPAELVAGGLRFELGPLHRPGEPSAMVASAQRIALPEGYRRLSLLLGAFGGGTRTSLRVCGRELPLDVPDSFAPAGRFDERRRFAPFLPVDPVIPGWLERQPLRLRVEHLLDRRGRIDPCRPAALYGYDFEVDPDGGELELPRRPTLLLFAATLTARERARAEALTPPFAFDRDPI